MGSYWPSTRRCLLALWMGLHGVGVAQAQQHYWYDGATRRPLWADGGLVADFSQAGRQEASVVLRARALSPAGEVARSPVFRDQADANGALRALPGGVLLRLRADTDTQARAALLARHRLTVLREIGPDGRLLLVASAPGEAALLLANRLHESGDFASVAPNWWVARRMK